MKGPAGQSGEQDEKGTKPPDECLLLSAESYSMQSSKNCTGNMQNAAIITQFEAIANILNARGWMKVSTFYQTFQQAAKCSAGVLEHPGNFTVSTTSHSPTATLFKHQKAHSKALAHFAVRQWYWQAPSTSHWAKLAL